jgi:hypothetical protein
VPTDFFKQDFINAQSYIYSQAIALQVQQKQERRALETAELARARAFLDLLASRDVHLKDRDRRVIASWQAEDVPRPSRIELSASNQPPVSALTLRGSNSVTNPPRSSDRDIELRSFVSASPSAADDLIATAARLRSTMVVYWVGEEELFIWVVSPDGTVQARRVSVPPARLVELIRETSPFAEKTAGAAAQSIVTRGESTVPIRTAKPVAWRALYDLLIQPDQRRAAENTRRAAHDRAAGSAAQSQLRGAAERTRSVSPRGLCAALRACGCGAPIHRAQEAGRRSHRPDARRLGPRAAEAHESRSTTAAASRRAQRGSTDRATRSSEPFDRAAGW